MGLAHKTCRSAVRLPSIPPPTIRLLSYSRPAQQAVLKHRLFSPSRSFYQHRQLYSVMSLNKALPECWGHRGASARFPENTLASFEAAMRDGAEGIESDVHVSSDGVVLMFHDPSLDRTTDGTGLISEHTWYGPSGMEHVRTRAEPKQSIPTFAETVALLMQPENHHVKFNVDIKVQNDPARLFSLMDEIIRAQSDWQTVLAPRILLGMWHPAFIPHAKKCLPYCRTAFIGRNLYTARTYFFKEVDAFSVNFYSLTDPDGKKFLQECRNAGKQLMVWTVNEPEEMMEAVRWGVDAILTDKTQTWLDLRKTLQVDYDNILKQYTRYFLWTNTMSYWPWRTIWCSYEARYLQSVKGPFEQSAAVVEPTAAS